MKEYYHALEKPLAFQPSFNNEMGQHMRLFDPETQRKYHIKFAKERFHTFGKLFPLNGSGEGESISSEVIDDLYDLDYIFFGTPDEIIRITKKDILFYGVLRGNEAFGDQTYSVAVERCDTFYPITSEVI